MSRTARALPIAASLLLALPLGACRTDSGGSSAEPSDAARPDTPPSPRPRLTGTLGAPSGPAPETEPPPETETPPEPQPEPGVDASPPPTPPPAAATDITSQPKGPGCEQGTRQVGETWNDGCNDCKCRDNGMVVCTRKACREPPSTD